MSSVMSHWHPLVFPPFHQNCWVHSAVCCDLHQGGFDFGAVEFADSAVAVLEDVVVVGVEVVAECGEGVGGEVVAVPIAADDCSLF